MQAALQLTGCALARALPPCASSSICIAASSSHESPRRGETFVTRKITRYLLAAIKLGSR